MLTALDQVANRNHLQLIKAAIPYVSGKNQRMLSLLIKMMELQNVMEFYQHSDFTVSACSTQAEQPGILDMLADMRNYCEGGEQQMLDTCIQMLSAMELYSIFAQSSDGGEAETESPE